MYWQETKIFLQFFTFEIDLLGDKELLHNILPKFGVCLLQLINLTFFNLFLIRSEVSKFSKVCLIIGKALRLFGLKVEIKGKIFLISCSFTLYDLFWDICEALFIPAFIIISG